MAKKSSGNRPTFTDQEALLFHSDGRPGKLEVVATKPMATQRDLSLAYSPGVAIPVLAIAEDETKAYDYTTRGNLVAFEGTCMRQHAGTKWLSTTAGVFPGEDFVLVLGIFDVSDSILDSYAFIDNFQWGCDGVQPPTTVPVG